MASNDAASQLERGDFHYVKNDQNVLPEKPTTDTDKTLTDSKAHDGQDFNDAVSSTASFAAALNRLRAGFCCSKRPRGLNMTGQRRMKDPHIRRLQDFPNGFPKLSCFLDSDDSFMIYRRFGTIFSRLLLSKQDELSKMEKLMAGMDKDDEDAGHEEYLMSRTLDDERGDDVPHTWDETRTQLLERMEKKTLEYAELLLKAQQLKALDKPSRRDYKSVLHFMENDGGPLFEEEANFIYEKEDLVSLRPGREHAWLDGILELLIPLEANCVKESKEKTDDEDIHYYDRDRIRTCTTMTITIMVLVLLVVPIWLLYHFSMVGTIKTGGDTIGVLLVFTLIFSAVLSGFTKAKRHEIVAASAG
ncbi:hypothetical protein ACLMJK_004367 [Lecanora helva]